MAQTNLHIVDVSDFYGIFLREFVFIDTHNHILSGVNASLLVSSSSFDFQFCPTRIDSFGHATHGIDFFNDFPCFVSHFLRDRLHHVAASPWIDHVADVGLLLNNQLGVSGNTRRKFGRQSNRFIKAIGMQTLGTAKNCRHGFNGSAHNVVVGVLLSQTPTRGLTVGSQHHALWIFCVEIFHDSKP